MTQLTALPPSARQSAESPSVRDRRCTRYNLVGTWQLSLIGLLALGCGMTESEFESTQLVYSDQAAESVSTIVQLSCEQAGTCEQDQTSESSSTSTTTIVESNSAALPLDSGTSNRDSNGSENTEPTCANGECGNLTSSVVPPTCEDGLQNGSESDIDCGRNCTSPCAAGQQCETSDDCSVDLLCTEDTNLCAIPSCDDQLRNGLESDIDCGGFDCPACPSNASCSAASDCESGVCGSDALCGIASCEDGIQNQGELQVDCGGNACDLCTLGSSCNDGSQCESGNCQDEICIATASCEDGLVNGNETGVDCGGDAPSCQACPIGDGCTIDNDCDSGACQDGICCGGSNGDCTRCAARLSTDACGNNAQCSQFLQCLRDNSDICINRFSSGCARVTIDPCFHERFGGEGGQGVQKANQVLVNASCNL